MPRAHVNGINVNSRDQGQGEPLVLLMGYSGDQTGWFFQRKAFSKHYRVITMDSRGVGKTDKPSGAYSMKMMAGDTVGLMDYLGVEKAHILGISMGGMIAQEIAISYPERVEKLILGCTAAVGSNRANGIGPDFPRALGLPEDYTDDDLRSLPILTFANSLYSMGFNKRLHRIILVPLAKLHSRSSSAAGLTGQLEAVLDHNTLDRLGTIGAPTLVITGADDRLVSPGHRRSWPTGYPTRSWSR